jgi:hypothetical protein
VEVIFGLGLLHELKKLAIGMVVAEAAKLAAAIFFIKSLRAFGLSIVLFN